eukprot:comp19444_c0_seq1/m.22592 comp19444_c0_seq1/g.22592  ORF comp19444_c0_seq1/g.22592 comp19444_c0_seq1/m.22592 type:complete len:400 (-) comp19444_c0_seq1:679-1878(-)
MVVSKVLVELHGHVSYVTAVHLEPKEDVYMTGSEDQSIRMWVKRENGVYWPCHIQYLDSPLVCLCFDRTSMVLYAGLASGSCLAYEVRKDFNDMQLVATIKAHVGKVHSVAIDSKTGLLISGGADGVMQLHSLSTKRLVGSHRCASGITAMAMAADQSLVYVGCASGDLVAVRVGEEGATHHYTYSGQHTGPIKDLAYDQASNRLFSGGADKTVVVWDLASNGTRALRLNKHTAELTSVTYVSTTNTLVSADTTGRLCIWDMAMKRDYPPAWQESDYCQLCRKPFFWNVQKTPFQISSFKIDLPKFNATRQHHCRKCGRATCADCVPHRVALPYYGYEDSVYICKECMPITDPEMTKSTLKSCEVPGVTSFHWVPGTAYYVANVYTSKEFSAKLLTLKQ